MLRSTPLEEMKKDWMRENEAAYTILLFVKRNDNTIQKGEKVLRIVSPLLTTPVKTDGRSREEMFDWCVLEAPHRLAERLAPAAPRVHVFAPALLFLLPLS
jgi:hypothetical protein